VPDDVVAGGAEPGFRRHRSVWFARIGGAALVAGLMAAALSARQPARHQAAAPAPSASAAPVGVDNPDGSTGSAFSKLTGERLVSVGPPRTILDAATGKSLGTNATVDLLDLDTAQVRPVQAAAPVVTSPSDQLIPVKGGVVIAPCDGCGAGRVYALPDGATTAVSLGEHDSAAPAADGNVLLVDARNQLLTAGDAPRPYRAVAHEVDIAGTAIGVPFSAPSGDHLIRGVTGGFLTTSPAGSAVISAAGTTIISFSGTIYASDSTTVVWARSCSQLYCAMLWTNLATMTTITEPAFPAQSFAVADAAFSPDSHTLAIVGWQGDPDITGKPQTQQVFFIRDPKKSPVAIAGSELRGDLAVSMAWSTDGKYVFFATSPQGEGLSAPRTLEVIPSADAQAARIDLPEFDGDSIAAR
jgi:hypothetical protein